MSASRRAQKPRYVLTSDRDRIAIVAGAACGFLVLVLSIVVQRHPVADTVFRALVTFVIVYAVTRPALGLVAHLIKTQSVAEPVTTELDVEEPEPE